MRRSPFKSSVLLALSWVGVVAVAWAGFGRLGHAGEQPPAGKPQVAAPADADAPQAQPRRGGRGGRVYKAQVTPHWFQNNTHFWYRNDLPRGAKEFILVDAEAGKRGPAFDHAKLAAALSKAAAAEFRGDQLPFDEITFVDGLKAVRFKTPKGSWRCDVTSYECTPAEEDANAPAGGTDAAPAKAPADRENPSPAADEADDDAPADPAADPLFPSDADDLPSPQARRGGAQGRGGQQQAQGQARGGQGQGGFGGNRSPDSPNGKWNAFVRDFNVFVRQKDGGKETQLTKDGKEELAYGLLQWSPDSKTLVAFRIDPADRKEVYVIQSSPPGGGRAVLQSRPYPLPGDKFAFYEIHLFDPAGGRQTETKLDPIDFGTPRLRWKDDGRHFTYQKVDRGHQRLRVIEVDAHTGDSRNLIDEQTKTFIWTAHTDANIQNLVTYLRSADEIVYLSEQDGWRHVYLYDGKAGKLKNQVTKGEWVVRGVDKIDEDKRQIWFRASGVRAGQDPYLVHFARVNFDGSGLTFLTEGDGNHTVVYSPDDKFLIDTYSRVDAAPVNELRRVADGSLVCALETADAAELKAGGFEPPEVFVAKGRDGKTDIWGVITRPRDFDPAKKYPVIESIYAGPQGSFVPKTFSPTNRYAALANLGFVVVQMDGMGTANRSKAFHDVCWHNLKDAGFEDRILWHKAAAAKYPYYDVTRVGVYGTSAGGQNAAGAVLFHPEFYKAAVANSGCHDNRMDKASWNEQWMGYPVGPQYAESSNIDHAAQLRGHLSLVVPEMDTNVPPESTFRFVDALVKAGKDFDFLVVPGANHGAASPITQRRLQDFFVRHLQGKEPPNRNDPG